MNKITDLFGSLRDWFSSALVFFLLLLPFQFALNPTQGIDLALTRVVIPIFFCLLFWQKSYFKEFLRQKNLLGVLILFFLFLAFFSIISSHNLAWSFRKLLFLYSIFPVYFVLVKLFPNTLSHKRLAKGIVLGATLLATLSLLQFLAQFIFSIETVYDVLAKYIAPFFLGKSFSQTVLTYPSWLVASEGRTYMRAVGTFPDPHMLAYYLGLTFPWAVALSTEPSKNRRWCQVAAFIILLADIATFTRGAYLALIASALIIMPLVDKKNLKKMFGAVAIIAFLFTIAPHSPVAGRLTSSFDVQEGSNQARLSNWQQALVIIKNNPLGVGIGMYPLAVEPGSDYRKPIYAHNLYLDIFAELGIIALLVFVAILLSAFLAFWKSAKTDSFYIAGVFSIALFSIHSMVESPLYSVHVLTIFLVIIALASTLPQNENISA